MVTSLYWFNSPCSLHLKMPPEVSHMITSRFVIPMLSIKIDCSGAQSFSISKDMLLYSRFSVTLWYLFLLFAFACFLYPFTALDFSYEETGFIMVLYMHFHCTEQQRSIAVGLVHSARKQEAKSFFFKDFKNRWFIFSPPLLRSYNLILCSIWLQNILLKFSQGIWYNFFLKDNLLRF